MVERERPVAVVRGKEQERRRRPASHSRRMGSFARRACSCGPSTGKSMPDSSSRPSPAKPMRYSFGCHSVNLASPARSVTRRPARIRQRHVRPRRLSPGSRLAIRARCGRVHVESALRAYARNGPASVMPNASPPCACGRLRRATRALTQLYDDLMEPSGLRVTQFSLLRTLERTGPQRITALAATALLDRTALTRTLDPLVEQGFVAIVPGARRAHARGGADTRGRRGASGRRAPLEARAGRRRQAPGPRKARSAHRDSRRGRIAASGLSAVERVTGPGER